MSMSNDELKRLVYLETLVEQLSADSAASVDAINGITKNMKQLKDSLYTASISLYTASIASPVDSNVLTSVSPDTLPDNMYCTKCSRSAPLGWHGGESAPCIEPDCKFGNSITKR